MRTAPCIVVVVASVLAALSYVRADGPITAAQCAYINPNPQVTNCNFYLPPIVDVYGNLPYDTVPAYSDCVKARCVCTGAAVSTNITTGGIHCNESGWMESGFTTCNRMSHCFADFWSCVNTAAMTRRYNNISELTSAELDLTADIVGHGSTPGEDFEVTDVYRSCRLITCVAANSRENCGLVTCLPNYTQCNEYILPPPLPYTHQLCTQGCRAALLMMAVTISAVSFAFCCMCCCPRQVTIRNAHIKDELEAAEKKVHGSDDETESEADKSSSNTRLKSDTPAHS